MNRPGGARFPRVDTDAALVPGRVRLLPPGRSTRARGFLLPGEFQSALAADRLAKLRDLLDWRENRHKTVLTHG